MLDWRRVKVRFVQQLRPLYLASLVVRGPSFNATTWTLFTAELKGILVTWVMLIMATGFQNVMDTVGNNNDSYLPLTLNFLVDL